MDVIQSYFQCYSQETQWFLLCEFKFADSALFDDKCTDWEIVKSLMDTRVLNKEIFHPEMEGEVLEMAEDGMKNSGRPFVFDSLEKSDFIEYKGKAEFQNWLQKFREEGWEDDREDAQILINRAEGEINRQTDLKNGLWHLSKDKFTSESPKLIEIHWVCLHFETFVEIDREKQLVRTFDFGYD